MNNEQKELVPIGEAARQAGMSVRRVRYLSDQGDIPKPFKSVSGDITYRLYTQKHIQQLKTIKSYQDAGYTLRMAVQKTMEENNYA